MGTNGKHELRIYRDGTYFIAYCACGEESPKYALKATANKWWRNHLGSKPATINPLLKPVYLKGN